MNLSLPTTCYLLPTVIAYFLDLIFGDPQWRWHPVRLIGKLIEILEKRLNTNNFNRLIAGGVLVITVTTVVVLWVYFSLELARLINPIFYLAISSLYIYFALSIKDLAVQLNNVYLALKNKDKDKASKSLSLIVGRDTEKLSESEIIRASVETAAESTMDGIIAPLFFAFLGGPVLVWAYKTVNTLDSMVGYKNEKFMEFGRASAKIDGLLNLIPSRLTCFFINISCLFSGKNLINSIKWGLKYLFKGPDGNSEATEAAMAGALGIKLGGVNFYNSVPTQKAYIGDSIYPLSTKHIKESIRITYTASILFVITGIFLIIIFGRR